MEVEGGPESARQLYSELTGANGRVRFKKLPPGDYWIKVEFLGIGAGYQCFHINPSPSSNAKKTRRYEWGTMPIGVRQASGRFVDSKPKSGSTPIQRLINRLDTPIVGAQLELRQPFNGTTYETATDSTGHFSFAKVPEGIYVLHIAADSTRTEDSTDLANFLIEVGSTARVGSLLLRQSGGMEGTSLQIEVTSSPS